MEKQSCRCLAVRLLLWTKSGGGILGGAMSQENVDVVRRLLALWEGDAEIAYLRDDAAWARYKPGIEPLSSPIARLRGSEAVSSRSTAGSTVSVRVGSTSTKPGRARATSSSRSSRWATRCSCWFVCTLGSSGGARGRDPCRCRLGSARRQGRARRVLCGPRRGPRSRRAAGVGETGRSNALAFSPTAAVSCGEVDLTRSGA